MKALPWIMLALVVVAGGGAALYFFVLRREDDGAYDGAVPTRAGELRVPPTAAAGRKKAAKTKKGALDYGALGGAALTAVAGQRAGVYGGAVASNLAGGDYGAAVSNLAGWFS